MANTLDPMATNIAASGKALTINSTVEFNVGGTDDQTPLVNLVTSGMTFDQMFDFQVDVEAAQDGYNLWEAPSEALRARAVIVQCLYGAGGVVINPVGADVPFPVAADPTAGNGFMIYCNPSGVGLTTDDGATGPGIQKVTVSTENESRFKVYVFV